MTIDWPWSKLATQLGGRAAARGRTMPDAGVTYVRQARPFTGEGEANYCSQPCHQPA